MRSTLFYIPAEIAGLPVFGFGLLLALWCVGGVLYLGWLIRRQGFNADTRSCLPVILLAGLVIAFVLPAICDERGFPVRGYGVMLALPSPSAWQWPSIAADEWASILN